MLRRYRQIVLELYLYKITAPDRCVVGTGVINQYATHYFGSDANEVLTVLPADIFVSEPQVCLINKSCWLQGVILALSVHVCRRQPMQFLVDKRQQLVCSRLISMIHCDQEICYLIIRSRHIAFLETGLVSDCRYGKHTLLQFGTISRIFSIPCHYSLGDSALTSEGGYKHRSSKGDRVMNNSRLNSILGSSLIACALSLGTLVSTQTAAAQSTNTVAEANIPFAFQAGSQQMPAGQYRIVRESSSLVLLSGPSHADDFILMHEATSLQVPSKGKIVFHRYGDKYFLSQIWTVGNPEGLESSKTRAEKDAMKETRLAKNDSAPSLVEVAVNAAPQR
jgi:hypothetical protein